MTARMDAARRAADLGENAELRNAPTEAMKFYEEALSLLEEEPPTTLLVDVLRRRGNALHRVGESAAASAVYERALAAAATLGDRQGRARVLTSVGALAQREGDAARATEAFIEAASLASAVGDELLLAKIEQNRGVLASVRGDWPDALTCFRRSLAGYRRVGEVDAVAWILNNLGVVYRKLGENDRALAVLTGGLEIARAGAGGLTEGMLELNLAEVHIALRSFTRAAEHCARALALATQRGDAVRQAEALKVRGALEAQGGDGTAALATLETAHRLAEGARDALLAAEVVREIGLVRRRFGEAVRAAAAFVQARNGFDRIGAAADLREMEAMLKTLRR